MHLKQWTIPEKVKKMCQNIAKIQCCCNVLNFFNLSPNYYFNLNSNLFFNTEKISLNLRAMF